MKKDKPTQSEILTRIGEAAELFHTRDDESFATFHINGHWETWAIRSKGFKRFLRYSFYTQEGKPPSTQPLQNALAALEAKAQFEGPTLEVGTRLAAHNGCIYLDLTDDRWRVAEVTREGWSVLTNSPVKFRRSPAMLPLPEPERKGASILPLKDLINSEEESWILDVAWLVGALTPKGPYPVCVDLGEQGSAKSTRQELKRKLIDPIKAPLRSAPRTGRDLMIQAQNGWIISLDNVSYLPGWLSDALCCLATGGGFSTRQLYTDDEEMIFEACRPIALNGIQNAVRRQDLVSRSIFNHIPPIPEHQRRTKREILDMFRDVHPIVLGGLLNAVSAALRNYDSTKLDGLPRMADFAKWVVAAESALPWPEGTFIQVYGKNRMTAIETSLESDLLGTAVIAMMKSRKEWDGSPTELYDLLGSLVDDTVRTGKRWPGSPNWMSQRLKRSASFLRSVGIDTQFPEQGAKGKGRVFRIRTENSVDSVDTVDDHDNSTLSKEIPSILRPSPVATSEAIDAIDGKNQQLSMYVEDSV